MRIVQYGGLGAFSTVSLRGAPPGQVAVYLDGAPLTSAAHGTVDVSDLPSGMVERIEVYRGMSPLGLGAATPGGAVNLVTSDAARVRTLRVAGGSFGTSEVRDWHRTRVLDGSSVIAIVGDVEPDEEGKVERFVG